MSEYMVCPGCRRWYRRAEPGDVLRSMVFYGCVPTVKEVANAVKIPENVEFILSVDLCLGCEGEQPGGIKFFEGMGERGQS